MLSHSMLMSSSGGLLQNIVFDTAAKVSNYSIRLGSPSVGFDSTNGGMSISGPQSQNFVAYDGVGAFNRDVAFISTIKLVSNPFNYIHFGLFLDSGASGVNGYHIAYDNNKLIISKFVGSSETRLEKTIDNSISFAVGDSHVFRAEIMKNGLIRALIDGNLIMESRNYDFATLRPGFFVYGVGIVVKDISVFAL